MNMLRSLGLALAIALPLTYLGFCFVYMDPNILLWTAQMRLNYLVIATKTAQVFNVKI